MISIYMITISQRMWVSPFLFSMPQLSTGFRIVESSLRSISYTKDEAVIISRLVEPIALAELALTISTRYIRP